MPDQALQKVHANRGPQDCCSQPRSVFKTVAVIKDCPRIIRSVAAVELLSTGRIRAGARVRINRVMDGHETIEELEVETFERPRRLRLIGESCGVHYERHHVIDALHVGSRLALIFRSRPETAPARAAQDFFTPFMQINLRDELERDLVDLAAAAAQSVAKSFGISAH